MFYVQLIQFFFQFSSEENILIVGAEDGTVRLYYIHSTKLKDSGTSPTPASLEPLITLVQVEKPHESSLIKVSFV